MEQQLTRSYGTENPAACDNLTKISRAVGKTAAYLRFRNKKRTMEDIRNLLLKSPEWSLTAAVVAGLMLGSVFRNRS